MNKGLIFAMGSLLVIMSSSGAIDNYNELVERSILSCQMPSRFLSDEFTNSVVQFRIGHTGAIERSTADLSIALSLSYRRDNVDGLSGDAVCHSTCVDLLTNIVYNSNLSSNSWIRYAAAFEYAGLLNEDGKKDASLCLSTNALSSLAINPPDMSVTNFWNALIAFKRCPNTSIADAFRMNAALILADENKWLEVQSYTNQLPASLIMLFAKDVE